MALFNPFSAQSSSISVSVTSIASTSAALPGKGNTLRIVNEGPNVCFIHVASGVATAVLPGAGALATCTPIMPGDTSLGIPADAIQNISAICRAGQSATLTVQVGEGV
jgi:hypothetical protein